ncbi:MAG: T9SS type A sorting domain-containing protein, partial [Rhodothermales bacterium]
FTFRLRENVGAKYYNSIFTEFPGGAIRLDDGDADPDAVDRFTAGDIEFANNIFFGYGGGTTLADLNTTEDAFAATFTTALTDNNQIVDPGLTAISRTSDGMLDPRPGASSVALSGAAYTAAGLGASFFDQVTYLGAFGADLWIGGWTALSQEGTLITAIEQISEAVPEQATLGQNYPNPFNPATTIEYQLESAQQLRLSVYDVLGREVAVLVEGVQPAGTFRADFDAVGLASGVYLYKLQTETTSLTRTMTLLK